MPQQGLNSYLIVGAQADWEVALAFGSMKQKVYEFISASLRKISEPITPTRFKRNPSPVRQMPGMMRAEGDISLHLHAEDMLIWLQHLLMDSAVASVDFTVQEVFGNGAGAGKAFSATTNSLDTQPTATSPASDPGKLTVTFDAPVRTGTVVITGTDQNDTPISDTLTFIAANTVTSAKYFKSVDVNGVAIALDDETGTMLITCDKNTYTHTIEIGDTVEEGLTIELVKGALPNYYIGCLLNSGTLALADTITLTTSILAKTGELRKSLQTGNTTPTDITAYAQMSEEVYPGWGYALQIDSVQTEVESASFVFNNNLGYPTRYRATRPMTKPVRQGDREISLTASVDYDTVNANFDLKYESDQVVAAVLTGVRKPYAGPEYSYTITMPRCQFTAFPDPEVTDMGDMRQELSLRPIRATAGATTSNEVNIVIVSTEATV